MNEVGTTLGKPVDRDQRGQTSTSDQIPNHPSAALTPEAFRLPPAETRIMPFWFWNTHLDRAMIDRQVAAMADAGIGGFFIHPRQGLEIPYLSAQWFELVKIAVEAAVRHHLHVWIYDEYPYPSGMAGGQLVADHPEFRARILEYQTRDLNPGQTIIEEFEMGRVVSAQACPVVNGQTLWDRAVDLRSWFGVVLTRKTFWRWKLDHCPYNDKRFMADKGCLTLQWSAPSDSAWKLYIGLEREQRGFKYYDWFFDPLCPGASEAFVQLTHHRYAEEVGEYFGSTIKGVFTDETEPSEWSPEIEKALFDLYGLGANVVVPALHDDTHPLASMVRYRFKECALRLFQERWETPIAEWCREWGLLWGAEKPTYRPSQFLLCGEPATDAGHRLVGDAPEPLTAELRSNARAALGAAEQMGTSTVRCECFHSIGWSATLQDQKWQIDWLAAQGVNRFTPHAFFASIGGLRKYDAAPSFFEETPAWETYHLLAEYTARLSLALSCGTDSARIAILHPTETLWIGGAFAGQARAAYESLMNDLMEAHRSFHPVDAQVLAKADAEFGRMTIGRANYQAILVPPLTAASNETFCAIRKAIEAEIPVLMAPPLADLNLDGTSVTSIFRQHGITPVQSACDWLEVLDRHLPAEFSLTNESGERVAGVWSAWRDTGSQRILFLANTTNQPHRLVLQTEEISDEGWEDWSLETGEIRAWQGNPCIDLAAYGSVLLVHQAKRRPKIESKTPASTTGFPLPIHEDWELRLLQPNALRLNQWNISRTGAERERGRAETRIEALPLHFLDKGNEQWIQVFVPGPDGMGHYRRSIVCHFVPPDLSLSIESDAIDGKWSLEINGQPISLDRFSNVDSPGPRRRICPVALYFHEGVNDVVLRIPEVLKHGGLSTPIHLLGTFSLRGNPMRELSRLATTASPTALAAAGFPHFSGTACFLKTIDLPCLNAGDFVEIAEPFLDVAELVLNGEPLGVRAWSPYRWVLPKDFQGPTQVELRITNTLLPFLEGRHRNPVTRELVDR